MKTGGKLPGGRLRPPNGQDRINEVRRRARRIMERDGLPYHLAMKEAGLEVRIAANDRRPVTG
jgi:hypothetical protein